MDNLVAVDFETEAIEALPAYPPKPVGVAIDWGDRREYLAWGHREGNNCTRQKAVQVLRDIFLNRAVLCHHCAFDLVVAVERMGVPWPAVYHDTLFLAFLHNPADDTLSLKPLAKKYLKWKAAARDALQDWILANVPGATEKNWGRHISAAPGELVGRYARDDVGMTRALFDKFYPLIVEWGMREAYERELKLVPIIWRMEKHGVHIALNRLKRAVTRWRADQGETERRIRRILRVGKEFNLRSGQQLADALEAGGLAKFWYATEGGARSTAINDLEECVTDKNLLALLRRRGKLEKMLTGFAYPWIEMAERNDGKVFPRFNQVRSSDERGNGFRGTRSGRLSSEDPNFQNIPKMPEDETLPNMRDFIIPDPGTVFIDRDYNQQELRILAHFAGGALLAMYLENPRTDLHTAAQQLIYQLTGKQLERRPVKVTGFGILYGMGVGGLATTLKISRTEAAELREAYLRAVPGVRALIDRLSELAQRNQPLRTWGGRLYYCEPPAMVNGKVRTFEYKMLNYLIQASAADCSKQAMINIDQVCNSRLVLMVHDEFLSCAKEGREKREMARMKEAMEAVQLKLPMLSDGKVGRVSWGRMAAYVDPARKGAK
jgi:DNA polymerase-1